MPRRGSTPLPLASRESRRFSWMLLTSPTREPFMTPFKTTHHARLRHLHRQHRQIREDDRSRWRRIERLRRSEVEHFDRAVLAHFDVGGLQIAMDDPAIMRGFERR